MTHKTYWYNENKKTYVEIISSNNEIKTITTVNDQCTENTFTDLKNLVKVLKQKKYKNYRVTYGL
jgi:disulfide oxidoreductase YuzD